MSTRLLLDCSPGADLIEFIFGAEKRKKADPKEADFHFDRKGKLVKIVDLFNWIRRVFWLND